MGCGILVTMTCGRWSNVGSLWGIVAGCAGIVAGLTACATTPAGNRGKAAPPPEDAAQYYPLQSGWKWAYEIERGGETILAVYAVVQREGEVAVLQAGEEKLVYAVRPDGIVRGEPVKDAV